MLAVSGVRVVHTVLNCLQKDLVAVGWLTQSKLKMGASEVNKFTQVMEASIGHHRSVDRAWFLVPPPTAGDTHMTLITVCRRAGGDHGGEP